MKRGIFMLGCLLLTLTHAYAQRDAAEAATFQRNAHWCDSIIQLDSIGRIVAARTKLTTDPQLAAGRFGRIVWILNGKPVDTANIPRWSQTTTCYPVKSVVAARDSALHITFCAPMPACIVVLSAGRSKKEWRKIDKLMH